MHFEIESGLSCADLSSCAATGEKAAIKMLLALQNFAIQMDIVTDMRDLSFLESLHSDSKDLVPARFDSVDKYLQSRGDFGILPFCTGSSFE
jgi:hypothetical protein